MNHHLTLSPWSTYLLGHPQGAPRCHTWPHTAAWWMAAGPLCTLGTAGPCGWCTAPCAAAGRGHTVRSTKERSHRVISLRPLSSPLSRRAVPTYLTPLAGHPTGRRAAAQVASHSGWWLGGGRAVPRGQSGPLICTLTKDHSVAETRPAARGALQLERVFYIQCRVGAGQWDTRNGQVTGGPCAVLQPSL